MLFRSEMFRMTLDLFYHLVDELKHYGYLKEGKGRVDVQESVTIFLYIVDHNILGCNLW